MRRLVIKFIGEVDFVGTKRYTIYENGNPIAEIYTHKDIREAVNEYWKQLKDYDVVIEYGNEE